MQLLSDNNTTEETLMLVEFIKGFIKLQEKTNVQIDRRWEIKFLVKRIA